MANWLDKALGRKSETTSVAIVPFDVQCPCGARLTGIRAKRAKRAICAQCGEAHFILPVNEYPESERTYFAAEPAAPAGDEPGSRSRAAQTAADIYRDASDPESLVDDIDAALDLERDDLDARPSRSAAADEDDPLSYLDEPLDAPQRRQRRDSLYAPPEGDSVEQPDTAAEQPPSRSRPTEPQRTRQTPQPARRRTAPSGMIEVGDQDADWGETRRKIAWAVTGIAVLAIGTAFLALRSRSVDQAETELTAASDAGLAAFESGDFGEAHRQLQTALEALNTLGEDDEHIAPIRRMWQEADVVTHLLDGSLVDVVDATRDAQNLSREDWQRQFDVNFADRWLLLDLTPVETARCTIKADDGEEDIVETRLIYPWSVDDHPVHVVGIENLLTAGRSRIVLAGRLAGSEFDSDAQAWVVRLDPQASFLWTHFRSLIQLGFTTGDDTALRQVLEQQAREAGVTESETGSAAAGTDADSDAEGPAT